MAGAKGIARIDGKDGTKELTKLSRPSKPTATSSTYREADAIEARKLLPISLILVDGEFNSSPWHCIAGSLNIGHIRIQQNH